MAAIAHAFAEQNSLQTDTSGVFTDVVSITSGNFTTGKKYLIYATANINEHSGSGTCWIKLLHGSTDFSESLMARTTQSDSSLYWSCYGFLTLWTAVSGEGVKIQFRRTSNSTARVDQVSLLAINLSDDIVENTDWFFAERTTDDALGTTPDDGASVTFTPSVAGDNWLVLTYAGYTIGSVSTTHVISRIERSGEATSTTPTCRIRPPTATLGEVALLARAYNLGAASNTFKEVSEETATNSTRNYSSIFVLNLNKFRNHAVAYTDGTVNLGTTDYGDELQTISLTPNVTGDVWIVAYWNGDINSAANQLESRVQVDNSDQPSSQTSDNYQFRLDNDATSETPLFLSTMTSLSNSAHTIDLDGSINATTGTPTGKQRALIAVTMELAPTIELDTEELLGQMASF